MSACLFSIFLCGGPLSSLSLCFARLPICASALLLNYSYFYLTKIKSMMMLCFVLFLHECTQMPYLTFTCCFHCLCLLFLWFVTQRPSPTSLRFWSALGWLVIMLMQLCSIKVSLHLPAWHHPSLSLGAGTHTIMHNTFEHFFFFFTFYVFTHDAHDCTVSNICQSPFFI